MTKRVVSPSLTVEACVVGRVALIRLMKSLGATIGQEVPSRASLYAFQMSAWTTQEFLSAM